MGTMSRLTALIPTLLVVTGLEAAEMDKAELFRRLDADHDGRMGADEFLAGFRSAGKPLEPEREKTLRSQYRRMDADGDGTLTSDEFTGFYRRASATTTATTAATAAAGAAAATKPPVTAPVDDDEKDEVDPNLARKVDLHPWTDFQRRSVENILLPAATTIPAGHFHWRIVHVAREAWYEDTATNLLGLDDSVKIGLQIGYGIMDRLDVNLIRTNGRTLQVGTTGKPVNMDYYDLLFKYRVFDQFDGAPADVSVVAGTTVMLRNYTHSDLSLDAMVVVERNLFADRLRLGVGLVHAGLSGYEPIAQIGPGTKPLPDEYDAAVAQGTAPDERPANSTTSVSLTLKIALSERWQLFGETILPTGGWRTHAGPGTVAGFKFNTHTHEYSFYFSNTANVSFNNIIAGGADHFTNLPVFGFAITAHL